MTRRNSDPRYGTQRWRKLRAYVIRRDGRRCSVPGCTTDLTRPYSIHVDHIVEVSDGADFWDPNNLRVLCKQHHLAKTQQTAAERVAVSPNA